MEKPENRKKELFTVPDGYFEQLNSKILDATANRHKATPRRKSIAIGKLSRITGYAAAIAILIGVTTSYLAQHHKTAGDIASGESVYADSEYIDNILNSYPIDEYTFYCYLTDTDFE